MDAITEWIQEVLLLPRPEYPKQAEALLTDLIWRSPGSILSGNESNPPFLKELSKKLPRSNKLPNMDRLIPKRASGGNPNLIETFPLAQNTPIDELISTKTGSSALTKALLESILAPRSRGDRSLACVPIHPQAVILQTLHGLVNKTQPPDMAESIEVVGRLGGSGYKGEVASSFLQAISQHTRATDGLTGIVEAMFPHVSAHVWKTLPTLPGIEPPPSGQPPRSLPAWPSVISPNARPVEKQLAIANIQATPFQWFWQKWNVLCNPEARWHEMLPTRRFTDWALCLLRTGLAFAYLWEADFFCKLYDCVKEYEQSPAQSAAFDILRSTIQEGAILATINSPRVPITQKDAWKALSNLLARGYEARERFKNYYTPQRASLSLGNEAPALDKTWLVSIPPQDLSAIAAPLDVRPDTAKNAKYFVRYLLQSRLSDDDSADQADFYNLARTNSNSFWFEPGPEWLVIVTSLLCKEPGGQCTLRMLLNDLTTLGIKIERSVLVGMLEEAGLSMDSPDADEALVIKSAF